MEVGLEVNVSTESRDFGGGDVKIWESTKEPLRFFGVCAVSATLTKEEAVDLTVEVLDFVLSEGQNTSSTCGLLEERFTFLIERKAREALDKNVWDRFMEDLGAWAS